MAMLADLVELVIGVDTHKHTHTAAIVTAATGAVVAQATVPATPAGDQQLLQLANQQPGERVWAIEGTGGYGAALTRFLHANAERVVELDRPKRTARRHGAKSDPLDATRAAREALGRDRLAQPRAAGQRAALQVRLTGPLRGPGHHRRPTAAARLGHRTRGPPWPASRVDHPPADRRVWAATPAADWDTETTATTASLRTLARRIQPGAGDRRAHPRSHHPRGRLAARPAHPLRGRPDRGRHRPVRLVACWPLPHRRRVRDARRCRADPCLLWADRAPSAQPVRRPPPQPGLHLVVLTRLRTDPATRAYATRRQAQGKTNREIKRCLVRYVARQLYRQLETDPPL